MNKRCLKYICLTGGIACGKSLAATYFKDLYPDICLIEADEIVHHLLKSDEKITNKIIETFGRTVAANRHGIDRKKLGKIVFKDYSARMKLEEILHPPVMEIIDQWKKDIALQKKSAKGTALAMAIIPLVFEKKYTTGWDSIICVAAPVDIQIERLIKYRNLTRQDALLRINAQLPIDEKMKLSDYVLINSGDKNFLKQQVANLLNHIKKTS